MRKRISFSVLVIMVVLFAGLFIGKGFNSLKGVNLGEKRKEVSASPDIEKIDWKKRYPFQNGIEKNEVIVASQPMSMKDRYVSVAGKFNGLGDSWSGIIPYSYYLSQIGTKVTSILSRPIAVSSYVRFGDNYWAAASYSKNIHVTDDNIKSLNDYVSGKGIEFLYVQPPVKICRYDKLPNGKKDYSNESLDVLMKMLTSDNVKHIDLRNNLHKEGLNHHSLFYDTDHHWKIETGLWAANEIDKALSDQCGIEMDSSLLKKSKYKMKTYKNAMFGSSGQSVSHSLASTENLNILFPCFTTDYIYSVPDEGINKEEGSFEKLFVDYNTLSEVQSSGGGYAYETFIYGNRPLEQITNLNNTNGPKILMIHDSFGIAVAPYLSMSCSELDMIDVRESNGNFTGSIRTYIDQMKPDIVMVLENAPDGYTWY